MNSKEIMNIIQSWDEGKIIKSVNKTTFVEKILDKFSMIVWDFVNYDYYVVDTNISYKIEEVMKNFDYDKSCSLIYMEINDELIYDLKKESESLLLKICSSDFFDLETKVLVSENFVCIKRNDDLILTLNLKCNIIDNEEDSKDCILEGEIMEENKVILNGKEISKEEFEKEKKRLEETKVQVVEVSKNNFKTRLQD